MSSVFGRFGANLTGADLTDAILDGPIGLRDHRCPAQLVPLPRPRLPTTATQPLRRPQLLRGQFRLAAKALLKNRRDRYRVSRVHIRADDALDSQRRKMNWEEVSGVIGIGSLYGGGSTVCTARLGQRLRPGIDIAELKGRDQNKECSMTTPESRAEALSQREFEEAFQAIRPHLSDNQLRMLAHHLKAPSLTVTPSELAEAAGWDKGSTANSQYGGVGTLLCEHFGFSFDINIKALVTVKDQSAPPDRYLWRMHDNAAKALRAIGWFS